MLKEPPPLGRHGDLQICAKTQVLLSARCHPGPRLQR